MQDPAFYKLLLKKQTLSEKVFTERPDDIYLLFYYIKFLPF